MSRNDPGWDPKSGFVEDFNNTWGSRWRIWLSHCTTGRKLAGSIPYDVTGIFRRHIFSGRTMALGSSQSLSEMSTRNISWGGKVGRCVGLATSPPSCACCHEKWKPQPPGILKDCPRFYSNCFLIILRFSKRIIYYIDIYIYICAL